MLRIFIATAITLAAPGSLAATPDFAEACYQAALEPPEFEITERIVGYCTTALASLPDAAARANLLTDRAILHIKRNNRMQARADLDEALKIDPDSLPARITASHLHWLEGNLVAAEQVLADVADTDGKALINRSIIRRTKGDLAGAIRDALRVTGYPESEIARLAPEAPESVRTPIPGIPVTIPGDTGAPVPAEVAPVVVEDPAAVEEEEPIVRD